MRKCPDRSFKRCDALRVFSSGNRIQNRLMRRIKQAASQIHGSGDFPLLFAVSVQSFASMCMTPSVIRRLSYALTSVSTTGIATPVHANVRLLFRYSC